MLQHYCNQVQSGISILIDKLVDERKVDPALQASHVVNPLSELEQGRMAHLVWRTNDGIVDGLLCVGRALAHLEGPIAHHHENEADVRTQFHS